ncbi:hypothetical protein HK097_000586 [Rhizophlyctis rosea]|uniref:Uncharacterized protein n=1 Tax=Rhizophlyctis rosea TaxID=64517 RepID=A0AAD5X1X3_9FUNG|nr:hypothetical protein HK097_000586 [Rhizophlyctis rosea]
MAAMAQSTDYSITDIPFDVLEDIFNYIQPPNSQVLTVPRETLIREYAQQGIPTCLNVRRGRTDRDSRRPYEVHLAAVCTTWRQVAMRLRNGDTINPRAYCVRECGDERLMEGYAILLGDSLRRGSARVLTLLEGEEFVRERSEFYDVLIPTLELSALRELEIGHWVALECLGLIAEYLENAGTSCLQTVKLTINKVSASSIVTDLQSFLSSLRNGPLTRLTLDLALTFPPTIDPRFPSVLRCCGFPLRLGHIHPYLTHLNITNAITLVDLDTSAPNLRSLSYDRKHVQNGQHDYYPPTLNSLQQRTLTSLFLVGPFWNETLRTIPRATLENLKEFGVYNSTKTRLVIPDHSQLFASWFVDMPNLTKLTIEDSCDCEYDPEKSHLFPASKLQWFLESLPCHTSLRSLKMNLDEWQSEMEVGNVPTLKEVDFTFRKPMTEVEMEWAARVLQAKGMERVSIGNDLMYEVANMDEDAWWDDEEMLAEQLGDLVMGAVPYSDDEDEDGNGMEV